MRVAGGIVPAAVPEILGEDPESGCLRDGLPRPADHPVWKTQLRTASSTRTVAAAIGDVLGRIHAATADRPDIAARFPTDEIFYAIRLEPYLVATARAHPDLAPRLARARRDDARRPSACWSTAISARRTCWSGPHGPVILDAECAWYGDPAFDSRVRAQPPAAQGRVAAAMARALHRRVRRSRRRLPRARRVGAARGARRANRGAAARAAARAHRRQVAGRVPDRRRGPRRRPRVRARAARDARGRSSLRSRPAGSRGRRDEHRDRAHRRAPRLRFARPADRRGRGHARERRAGRAIAPAGASRGSREAVDLRDGGGRASAASTSRARSRTSQARSPRALLGLDAVDQAGVDAALVALDGTPNKARLGGNATVAVSLAVGACGGRRARPAAVAASRRRRRGRAAAARDPDLRRRRARRAAHRHPGPDGDAVGGEVVRRGARR